MIFLLDMAANLGIVYEYHKHFKTGQQVKKNYKAGETILSIDMGTQSVKAALIDCDGDFLSYVKVDMTPYYSVKPGWAEQDPEYYWSSLKAACRKLLISGGKKGIKGVTITTQRSTMINLGRDGKPLRPAIVWLDQREAAIEKWPPFYMKAILGGLKLLESVKYTIRNSDANWIRQNEPEIWGKTCKFLQLSGYLTYRLTGEFHDSSACQVGFLPFDYKKQAWAASSHIYWNITPMDRGLLPDLFQPGEILGTISTEAARETGIPAGLPLIASATDKACEVLGSGCLTPETACLSYGTTATIETTNSRYVEVTPFIPPFPSAVPGYYNSEVMVYRGYWMVSWFKKEFGHLETLSATKNDLVPEVLFDELIRDIEPGSMGLVLQPYWSPGVKIPGPEAKGAIIGFRDIHTRGHLYRAILEGIAYALKEGALRTERKNRIKIERLMVSGGGSQSREAMQLTADIFNMPAERPKTFETSALGAAIDAAVGLKFHSSFTSAVKAMTGTGDIFMPIKKNSEIYSEIFEKVYLKMYKRMKPLYNEIREII